MSLAWIVQRIVSAFHSAIRGGFMATRALLKFGFRRFLGKEFDDKDTYVSCCVPYSVLCPMLSCGHTTTCMLTLSNDPQVH